MTAVLDRPGPLEELERYHAWIWSLPSPKGAQVPRLRFDAPFAEDTLGPEAAELAASAGLLLDPWQCLSLDACMARRFDGPAHWGGVQWAAFEFGQVVSRQNGKGGWLEARELHALFVGREELIIHTAHKFDTSAEAFRRIRGLIKNTEELEREVTRESNSHGKEGIELRDGTRLLFKARSGGATRGFSADLLIWDEAMFLAGNPVGDMLPTLLARTDPQVLYTGSAGFPHSVAFGRLRRRCLKQARRIAALLAMGAELPRDTLERIAFHEFSVDEDAYRRRKLDPADPAQIGLSNPGMGYRLMVELLRAAMGSMGGPWSPEYGREILGVGDWPTDEDEERWGVIDRETWQLLADPDSQAVQQPRSIALGVETAWDRSATCIGLAGRRTDDRFHVQIPVDAGQLADYRAGPPEWAADRVAELVKRWKPVAVVVNDKGPAKPLIAELERRSITVTKPTVTELAGGYGLITDKVKAGGLRHLDQEPLNRALGGAATRMVGTATMWDMKEATTDSSPLVAVTNAMQALHTAPKAGQFFAAYR